MAVQALSKAGFTVDQKTKAVDQPDGDGVVIDEKPAGGTQAKKGSTVTITVGKYQAPGSTTPTTTTTTTPPVGTPAPGTTP
ncbi:MAG: PASTA domain-containing protein [Solirubrobacteraceae bacterium]